MYLSSRRLGEQIGLTAQQMKVLLKDEGYYKGHMGNYSLTEKGKAISEENGWDNGYGGYAFKGYNYDTFPESILKELNTKPENLERIRELTKVERIESKKINEELQKQYKREQLMEDVQNISKNTSHKGWIVIGVLSIATLGTIWYFWRRKKKKEKNI